MEYFFILLIQIILFFVCNHYVIRRIDSPSIKKISIDSLYKVIDDLSIGMNNQNVVISKLNKEYMFELQKYQKDEKWGINFLVTDRMSRKQLINTIKGFLTKKIGNNSIIQNASENDLIFLDFKNNIDELYLLCHNLVNEISPNQKKILCKFILLSDLGTIKRFKYL